MIDIGPNLSNEQFDNDLSEVIERAINSQIRHLILTSTDWKTYQKNLLIIEKYHSQISLSTTFGLHPHSVMKDKIIFSHIKEALTNNYVKAIGEFGLDYFRMIGPKEKQIEVMSKFLEYAQQYPHLSLFLHERGAFDDFYHLLKQSSLTNNMVVHCFTGTVKEATAYLDLGCSLGVTGWISDKRRNQDVVEAIKYIPLDKLMIETDCPYLTPFNMPSRPRRNEPSFLKHVAQSIADIKNVPIQLVIETTTKNSLDFFKLTDYNIVMNNNNIGKI